MARGDVHHDPTVPRVVAMNFALLDQALIGKKFHDASKEPNYGLMYPTREEEAVDKGLRDRTQKYYKRNGSMDDVKLKALNCIRAAEGTAVTAGTVMEGKRLIDLADGITAVPSLGSDDAAAYGFFRSTGELVESTEELLQELRAALGRTAPAGAETAGAAADGDDEIPHDDDGAGTNAGTGTGTGTGTGDDANAAGGGIGGFATPPANAVNLGSERQRGGTRSSGSSSSGARSVLSGIGSSIRNRRNRGRVRVGREAAGRQAARNLRDLPSPGDRGHGVDPPAAAGGSMPDYDEYDGGVNGDEEDEGEGIMAAGGGLHGNGDRGGDDRRRRRYRGGTRRPGIVGALARASPRARGGRGDDAETRALHKRIVKLERALKNERNANDSRFEIAFQQMESIMDGARVLRKDIHGLTGNVSNLKKQVDAVKKKMEEEKKKMMMTKKKYSDWSYYLGLIAMAAIGILVILDRYRLDAVSNPESNMDT